MQSSIHASLKWQVGGTPVIKWTGLYIFSLYLGAYIPAMDASYALKTHVSTSTLLCACPWYEHHYSFIVYLGLQVKWNQFGSNNSHHTSCIHKGSHAGKWPDQMTTTPADASTQWCSSGDPVLICIIGTHRKTTGATSTLGCHWNHTGWC